MVSDVYRFNISQMSFMNYAPKFGCNWK